MTFELRQKLSEQKREPPDSLGKKNIKGDTVRERPALRDGLGRELQARS